MLPAAQTALGRAIRLPLKWIPKRLVVPVLSGLNRGYRWRVGSSTHGCWLGTYESEKQQALRAHLRPGIVAYDIGAQAGFYTLAFARAASRVIAFEPLPANAEHLSFHLRTNRLLNVTIRPEAVSDAVGVARFRLSDPFSSGIHHAGELSVRTTTLDAVLAEGLPEPDLIKMDVEGAELSVLRGATNLLARRRAVWFIALHVAEIAQECRDLLLQAGYSVEELGPSDFIARPR